MQRLVNNERSDIIALHDAHADGHSSQDKSYPRVRGRAIGDQSQSDETHADRYHLGSDAPARGGEEMRAKRGGESTKHTSQGREFPLMETEPGAKTEDK